ncbi:MAG: acyl-CoA dehydrogenase family protein [Anaerolineae bacterium]|nr:MAG: acyl-CoA dehydrogenase family protein [Anaerolineae bacterium]
MSDDTIKTAKNGKRPPQDRTGIEIGRQLIEDWEKAQPDNYFSADIGFQRGLEYQWGSEEYKKHVSQLNNFGAKIAKIVDPLVRVASLDENLPRLERFDSRGERIEEVIFHPSHHEAGQIIYGSGMMSLYGRPGNNLLSLALFYLSSQNGEAGHNCPLACTAGLIKALQALGSGRLKERYLPQLLDSDYRTHFHGAQFLTEIQGGSDVGANATTAELIDDETGTWLLNGEKWFCSNVTADLALTTARVPGQGKGTKGLGLFLLPRLLEGDRLNNVYIRRLKVKFGTRSMATAELELRDAVAYQLGPVEHGFKNIMIYVINTSRVYNAVGVAGSARRAYLTARSYAEHRTAFGGPLIHFPIVQDMLANMRADVAALLSGTLHIVKLLDDLEIGEGNQNTEGFLRMAINLNKYRSSVLATNVIIKAIELLGGNGAIESFSVLPRLLRDNIVYENWEGTHNVLLAQVQRDIRRYRYDKPFFKAISRLLTNVGDEGHFGEGHDLLQQMESEIEEILKMDELTAAIYFRPFMDRLTDLYYVATLASEGAWESAEKKDRTKMQLAGLFFNRHIVGKEPKDVAFYDDLVSRLC